MTSGLTDRTRESRGGTQRRLEVWEQRSALLAMVRSLRCQWDIAEEGLGGGGVNAELFQGLGPCLGCLHPHFPGIQKSWGVRAPCTSSDPPSLSHLCLSRCRLLFCSPRLSGTCAVSLPCVLSPTSSPSSPLSAVHPLPQPSSSSAPCPPPARPPSRPVTLTSVSAPSPPTTSLSMFPGS